MRFSVICNTYNRAKCLRVLLQALEFQTYPDFEVIVVNGPSTDDTESVLREFAGRVRAYSCPKTNLSMSRNIGIAAAAGDVCTFIDDDGVPEPRWLNEMKAGFTGPDVAAVGGIVFDHTGCVVQYRANVCDRLGNPQFGVTPPLTPYQLPFADPFLYLPGGNTSYRRADLAAVGGFDEEIEYYLDETDVCMRLTDRGRRLHMSDRAAMLHKSAPSHIRNEHRVLRRPYAVVKNKIYFSLQSVRRAGRPVGEAVADSQAFADRFRKEATDWHARGLLTAAELDVFMADVDRAVRDGSERGVTADRKSAVLPPADPARFLPFPRRVPEGRRLAVCFVSSNYPPEPLGGIGRFTHDVARGMAADGHEVHVISRTDAHPTYDFEDGVWVHRVPAQADGLWRRDYDPPGVRRMLGWAAAAHAEAARLAADRPIDLVSAPVWDCEGAFCHLDDGLNTVLSLHTTLKTTADLNPDWYRDPGMGDLLAVEGMLVRCNRHLTAPSRDILAKVKRDYGGPVPPAAGAVIPHGTPDRLVPFDRRPADGRVRVLTVGRLEKRKGTDLLFQAAADLCPEFPHLEFVLVGDDSLVVDGRTYRQAFDRKYGGEPWADRVVFLGKVSEDELAAEYAACDVFCLPARYESFGLVLIEAMMFGKPVVAAAAGGMPEVVEDGVTGLLVYPDSPRSLTDNLRLLVADADLRARCGAAARERYADQFRQEVMVRNTVREYTRMVESYAV